MIHGFDEEAFQKRINEITGLNRDGKPIFRLAHAPSVLTWALGETVPRYWTKRTKGEGGWVYDQPDRWVFERRLEKETYWDAHEASRYQDLDGSGTIVDLGPPPEDYYVFDTLIAKHEELKTETGEPLCCKRAWDGETTYVLNYRKELVPQVIGGRQICWGVYREPDDSDLALIHKAVERMREDPYFNPYAPLSAEQLAALEASAVVDAQRIAEEARKRQADMNRDFNNLHGWRLGNTDAGKRSKFFFTGG